MLQNAAKCVFGREDRLRSSRERASERVLCGLASPRRSDVPAGHGGQAARAAGEPGARAECLRGGFERPAAAPICSISRKEIDATEDR